MPCWKVWSSFTSEAFPLLKHLGIHDCPKLGGDLPNHLPALETLTINNCGLLVSSLPRAPTLQTLEILESNKVMLNVFPPLVESIEVKGSSMVESMIAAIANNQPTCLQSLTLWNCSSAISFPGGRLPALLKTLNILWLKKLEFPVQHKHKMLESLSITNSCDSLKSLPLVTFPNLKSLQITKCENMESLGVSCIVEFGPKFPISMALSLMTNGFSKHQEIEIYFSFGKGCHLTQGWWMDIGGRMFLKGRISHTA
ncbi:hypothetical protein VNO78_25600 [Psophocarpus tetragonolobus]|uniref:Disease resistance protein n=1 Tax=Psophocarpus tetragonolobus TaxID=3891 RepID=A0AAN9XF57_PSOTE